MAALARLVCVHAVALNACGLRNQGQTVRSHREVELHRVREHDAGGLAVRHMAMATELMPNGVADTCAHAAKPDNRHPGAKLAGKTGVEILRIARGTRQIPQ